MDRAVQASGGGLWLVLFALRDTCPDRVINSTASGNQGGRGRQGGGGLKTQSIILWGPAGRLSRSESYVFSTLESFNSLCKPASGEGTWWLLGLRFVLTDTGVRSALKSVMAMLCDPGARGSAPVPAGVTARHRSWDGGHIFRQKTVWETLLLGQRLRASVCCWEDILDIFDQNVLIMWKTDKCAEGDLVILNALIWRAPSACEMAMKTGHVLEFLILLIGINSRSWSKHWLIAPNTERKIRFAVLRLVWLPAQSPAKCLVKERGPPCRQRNGQLCCSLCTNPGPYRRFAMNYSSK